jgi:hypothetical protein
MDSAKTFCLTKEIKIIDLLWPIKKMEYDRVINLMIGRLFHNFWQIISLLFLSEKLIIEQGVD